jgi:hypothetical protein
MSVLGVRWHRGSKFEADDDKFDDVACAPGFAYVILRDHVECGGYFDSFTTLQTGRLRAVAATGNVEGANI